MEHQPARSSKKIDLSRPKHLRLFTKLLREPIVISGSAYRSGVHPILATRVAAEVARSPKRGLLQQLMTESKQAFREENFPQAIVKSLAAEELLRKYGSRIAGADQALIQDRLQFLKIQYFLLSGQSGEAYKILKDIRHLPHPYLWHRRMAVECGVGQSHWDSVERTLRQLIKTSRNGKIFSLLGYTVVMGSKPWRAEGLAEEYDFHPLPADRLFEPLLRDYDFLTTRVTTKEKSLFPKYLASKCKITPLISFAGALFVGSARELDDMDIEDIRVRLGLETIVVPMGAQPVADRNVRLYAS